MHPAVPLAVIWKNSERAADRSRKPVRRLWKRASWRPWLRVGTETGRHGQSGEPCAAAEGSLWGGETQLQTR